MTKLMHLCIYIHIYTYSTLSCTYMYTNISTNWLWKARHYLLWCLVNCWILFLRTKVQKNKKTKEHQDPFQGRHLFQGPLFNILKYSVIAMRSISHIYKDNTNKHFPADLEIIINNEIKKYPAIFKLLTL